MCKIQKKRFFLPLIGIMGLTVIEEVISYTYLPVIVGFSSFILFWNFPKLAIFFNCRPFYYEDLYALPSTENIIVVDEKLKDKFRCIFEWCLIISSSILTGALTCYRLYSAETTQVVSYFEIIGITGGILKIYYMVNYSIGTIILHVLKKKIERNIYPEDDVFVMDISNN